MGEVGANPEILELVGLWSAGAGYYATFSDEWMIFRPDGTGRLVFLNPFDDDSHHFRWRVVASGVIDLIGSGKREPQGNEQAGGSNEFHFIGVRYSVAEAERPPGTGNWMRELHLDLTGPWPDDLGFVSNDYQAAEARLRSG
ncbi:hypothetical protein [Frigoriglobus tundricola]|uniref:DUF1579 domain-containing protein n=1 Tax=Frigoriglobus tundricola TaxID=2774151 RepID=A0A6M5Z3G7_9BACT|nr:hypothetical protein [Frigoriglobus tundricola]QJX00071.1 hypothetical protein FTUN_7695 [Frigoriglobus tundricola]